MLNPGARVKAVSGLPLVSMVYWITKCVLTPYLRLFFRIRVEGRENIPERGPAILASNHISFCDSFFLPLVVPPRGRHVAKAGEFEELKVGGGVWGVRDLPPH